MTKAKKKYYQRKDGLYESIRKINGKRVAFRGRSCAEVDRKILEYNVQAVRGRKVGAILDDWERERYNTVSISTREVYTRYLSLVRDWFGNCYAGDVKTADVCQFVADFEAKGYAAQTVSLVISIVKQVFSFAVRKGDIAVNPAVEVRQSRGLPRKTRRALTEDEERLVERFRGENYLLGLFLLYTGFRWGELLGLEWQDIDRRAGVIRLTRKLNYSGGRYYAPGVEDHLKNGDRERVIPLLEPLAAVLPKNRIGPIFHAPEGGYMTLGQARAMWRKYRDAVGLPKEITPHCFRHSLATICFEAGVSARDLAAFLGDTVQVAEKVYVELRDRHHASSAERVNAYLQMRIQEHEEAGAEG